MTIFKFAVAGFLVLFLLPALAHAALWLSVERPGSWREADWSSARVLPAPSEEPEASIRVMYARTGGLKGVLSVHSWIVLKPEGAPEYERYDVVGWGTPVRRNHRAADGFWYSNPPQVAYELKGERAARLIPEVRDAIETYAWSQHGSYRIWPGPNSNTFVATVLRAVPELDAHLPPTAIGRDYIGGGIDLASLGTGGWTASLFGVAAVTLGWHEGIELNLFGLVVGLRLSDPAIILPGFGVIGGSQALAAPGLTLAPDVDWDASSEAEAPASSIEVEH